MALWDGVRSGARAVLHAKAVKNAQDARSVRDVMIVTTKGVDEWAL